VIVGSADDNAIFLYMIAQKLQRVKKLGGQLQFCHSAHSVKLSSYAEASTEDPSGDKSLAYS